MMEGTDLTQLNKLERYLKENKIPYERIDQDRDWVNGIMERHQIFVHSRMDWEWDAICHYGSYGYEQGLLEIMGCIVPKDWGDSVEGHLTAEDVIERYKAYKGGVGNG